MIRSAEYDNVPRSMIIFGQNGVGKSTLLYSVKQSILENVMKNEDGIFISPLGESTQEECTGDDVHRHEPSVISSFSDPINACLIYSPIFISYNTKIYLCNKRHRRVEYTFQLTGRP